jgi:hypothetical protein
MTQPVVMQRFAEMQRKALYFYIPCALCASVAKKFVIDFFKGE